MNRDGRSRMDWFGSESVGKVLTGMRESRENRERKSVRDEFGSQ